MSLRDRMMVDDTKPGMPSALDRLMSALPPDEAADVRDVLADGAWGHAKVWRALNEEYGDHAAGPFTQSMVSKWRSIHGVKLL